MKPFITFAIDELASGNIHLAACVEFSEPDPFFLDRAHWRFVQTWRVITSKVPTSQPEIEAEIVERLGAMLTTIADDYCHMSQRVRSAPKQLELPLEEATPRGR